MSTFSSIFKQRRTTDNDADPSAWIDDVMSRRFIRTRRTEHRDDARAQIMVPRFDGRILGRYLLPLLKKPEFPIVLDDIGSTVWGACDGSLTGEDILNILHERFGDMDQQRQRLALFLRTLALQGHLGEALDAPTSTSMNAESDTESTAKDLEERPR